MKHKQDGFGHWLAMVISLVAVVFLGLAFLHLKHQMDANGNPLAGLSGLPACNGKHVLQESPVALSDLSTVVPLGNLAPPGHVIPTIHMYYNYKPQPSLGNWPAKTTLYVPADMTITKILLEDNQANSHPFNSYRIDFAICKNVAGYFYHAITLGPKLAGAMHPPWDSRQTSYVGTGTEHSYSKKVHITLKAGDILGTGGGFDNAPDGLDFGLFDTRVKGTVANPSRWHSTELNMVCSLDYYPVGLSAQLYQHIGDFGYNYVNPGNPKCGQIYQDVLGTAQGVWLENTAGSTDLWVQDQQMALVHSNFNHSQGVFSFGNDVKKLGLDPALYTFTPAKSGIVNLDFNLVKPGHTYCYDTTTSNPVLENDAILVQLTDAKTLKLGKLASSSCGAGPWSFGQSLTYVR